MQFEDDVDNIFDKLFSKRSIKHAKFHRTLVDAIVSCFHIAVPKIGKVQKARIILHHLFASFQQKAAPSIPFSLNAFIDSYVKKQSDVKRFVISLLYALYYEDISLKALFSQDKRHNVEYLMFQLLAETVSETTLRKIIEGLTFDKLISLISYALRNYREGSFYILKTLKEVKHHKNLDALITGLRRNYFNIEQFHQMLLEKDKLNEKMHAHMMAALEKASQEEAQQAYIYFNALIPLIASAPIRILEANVKAKRKIVASYQPSEAERQSAELLRQNLYLSFESFFIQPPTFAEFHEFTRLFGLHGHHLLFKVVFLKHIKANSLEAKLKALNDIFANPHSLRKLSQHVFFIYVTFALPILWHIEAMRKEPSKYKEGLDQMAFGMATKGKSLDVEAGLHSVLNGLSFVVNHINVKSTTKILLSDYPIFVYDQSNKDLFAKNERLISRLNQHNKSSIIHISNTDILELAKKLGVANLINTTRTGELGYGGARNTVYLLTPVLRAAFCLGHRTIGKIIALEPITLNTLFQQYVLGGKNTPCGETIFMVDDDMEIPEINLLSHAMLSQRCASQYFVSFGIDIGRGTKYVPQFPNFKDLLDATLKIFITTKWRAYPQTAGLSECLSKPGICLNVPMGSEENQLKISERQNFLLQPSYHLAGTRHPTKEVPTHYFVGLDEFLKAYIPYHLRIALADSCIDASQVSGRCIFPWHDPGVAYTFNSLGDVFAFISRPEVKTIMQKKFWKNVHDLFFVKQAEKAEWLSNTLESLLNTDINTALMAFLNTEDLGSSEKASLTKIANVYAFYQQDAKLFLEFGHSIIRVIKSNLPLSASENWFEACIDHGIDLSSILESTKTSTEKQHQININKYPLSSSFYLLCRSAGLAEFGATENNHHRGTEDTEKRKPR